jgi:hypothetical protein
LRFLIDRRRVSLIALLQQLINHGVDHLLIDQPRAMSSRPP